MYRFEFGGQTRVTATFDAAITPAARVKAPDGTVTTPTPTATGEAENQYYLDITRNQAGTWSVRIYDAGGIASADEQFVVDADPTAA